MARGIEASFVFAGRGDAIRDGAVVVDDRGSVLACGEAPALRAAFAGAAWERHEGVLIPGLVNARVSLELSALRGRVPGGRGFVPWLRALTDARDRSAPELDVEAIEEAVSELVRTGTAAVGEVTRTLASLDSLGSAPLVARVYHEVAGLRRETATVIRAMAEEAHERARVPANVDLSLAPHSLIGLHPGAMADLFADETVPIAMPLAWTAAERAYLRDGGGPFAAWLSARGADPADRAPPGRDAIAQARALGVLGPGLLATHLTDARPDELGELSIANARAALCPRASLHVEVKLPPLLDVLAAGIEPGLGTDSLASAPSLDVLEEALALHRRFPSVDPSVLLSMATSFGARALGLEHVVGAFAPGLSPGVILFEAEGVSDPLRHVLAQAGRPRRVLVRPGCAIAR